MSEKYRNSYLVGIVILTLSALYLAYDNAISPLPNALEVFIFGASFAIIARIFSFVNDQGFSRGFDTGEEAGREIGTAFIATHIVECYRMMAVLHDALIGYGQHTEICPFWINHDPDECDCGYEAVLSFNYEESPLTVNDEKVGAIIAIMEARTQDNLSNIFEMMAADLLSKAEEETQA